MRRTQWSEPVASTALCWLQIDAQKSTLHGDGKLDLPDEHDPRKKYYLPSPLYSETIASFLHFDEPLNNQLYAVGGRTQQQGSVETILDTVEMFDTWHGKWVTCPSMSMRRAGCAAAVLPDGRIMVVGGYNENGVVNGLLSSCEIFNPAIQTWDTECNPLQRARWGHGCASLGGLVYVVGGCAQRPGAPPHKSSLETLKGCEVYEPSSNTWSFCTDLNVARAGSRVVSLSDRFLAAVGGCDDVFGLSPTMLPSVELFDILSGKWMLLDVQLSTPRTTAAVVAMDDKRILVMGGGSEVGVALSSAEVYHVHENGNEDHKHDGHRCMSASARPPARGRRRRRRKQQQIETEIERPRVSINMGPTISDMVEGRMGCQAATLDLPAPGKNYPVCTQQCVLVVGGENDENGEIHEFSKVLVYDVQADEWRREESVPPMPTPRVAMALCVGPGRISGYL